MVKAGSLTDNGSVPTSEHVSRTIAINTLYSVLSVLHFHFGTSNNRFTFITDSVCSAKLYREGCENTVKLSTNTRLQKEQLPQLSTSFPNGTVMLNGIPSSVNLADTLTKISKKPVELVNSAKFRNGLVKG